MNSLIYPSYDSCPVCWGYGIHRLHLGRGVRPPANEYPRYDTEQSDGEVSVMLEIWRMRSTLYCQCFQVYSDPEWLHLIRVLSMGHIELNRDFGSLLLLHLNCVFMINWIVKMKLIWHLNCVLMLNRIDWNRTVLKLKLYYVILSCSK